MIRTFRDLNVYNESYQLIIQVHRLLLKFPLYERNDLVSQLRRASKSIPANIAEGWAKRTHEKDFKRYLSIAIGSAIEMQVHLEIARDLGYLEARICNDLIKRYQKLGGMITRLRQNWKTF